MSKKEKKEKAIDRILAILAFSVFATIGLFVLSSKHIGVIPFLG